MQKLYVKIRTKIRYNITKSVRGTWIHPFLHGSYWHFLIFRTNKQENYENFLAARPNAGAGIGHQLANWISGYYWAKQFNLKFAHIAFPNHKWEFFLGLGEEEEKVTNLLKNGYKKVYLPYFNQHNSNEKIIVRNVINSYSNQKVIFIAEQDQDYTNQQELKDVLKKKFNNSIARKTDILKYDSKMFNIAVHVRRTVVIEGIETKETDKIKSKRWLAANYYETVLKQVLFAIKTTKPIVIYLFTTGEHEEFAEFSKHGNIQFCSEMDEYASFLHLTRADLIITSKSSFSYKPALMNDGIKICPRNFWHGYPEEKDWIMVENDGSLDVTKLINCI